MQRDEPSDAKAIADSLGDPCLASDPRPVADAAAPSPGQDRPFGEIYAGCPVTALGYWRKYFYYLDIKHHLQELDTHTLDRISGVFGGRADLLEAAFPRWGKEDKDGQRQVLGWRQDKAREAMQQACSDKGIWKERERVRGLGAWPDANGDLLLHCGDVLLKRDETGAELQLRPGEHEGYVYPMDARAPHPANADDGECRRASEELLSVLETWQWTRGPTDAYLLLGWIAAAMVGGALKWRPVIWITGDAGTGKSTVQDLIANVLGGTQGLVTATDATEAGIRQVVMQSTLPVALDEAEAEEDSRRMVAIIKLARQAASGGLVLRGGADHKGAEFRVRSCFLFSSILIPPLKDQDISRIAVLDLNPLDRSQPVPKINPQHWQAVGRRIRRRLFDKWDRLHDTLEAYRIALNDAGHSARGADQFGTLLALADLVLEGGDPTPDVLDGWKSKLNAEALRADTDQSANWERMLTHLFSTPLDLYRTGGKFTIGEVVAKAAHLPGVDIGLAEVEAREYLRRHGIAVEGRGKDATVYVANNHQGLAPIFRDTEWNGGVHRQSLRRIPGAFNPRHPKTMAGARTRVTAFRLSAVPWFAEGFAAQRTPEPADL